MSSRASKQSESRPPEPPEIPDELTTWDPPAELRDVELALCRVEAVELSERDASRLQVAESRMAHVNLSGCGLEGAKFHDVIVEMGSWANVRAAGLSLTRVRLDQVRLTGASLASAEIRDVTFVDCRIDLAAFRFAKLERVRFDNCRMDEVDFYGASLTSVVFTGCSLVSATWSAATLTCSEIRGCDLAGAKNTGAATRCSDAMGRRHQLGSRACGRSRDRHHRAMSRVARQTVEVRSRWGYCSRGCFY